MSGESNVQQIREIRNPAKQKSPAERILHNEKVDESTTNVALANIKKEKLDTLIRSIKLKFGFYDNRAGSPHENASAFIGGETSESSAVQTTGVDAQEAAKRRNELFSANMKDNPLWVHATKAEHLASILDEGLRPAFVVSEDTLARWPGYSENPRYTGGPSGSVIFWHLRPGDTTYEGEGFVGVQTASISRYGEDFEQVLPSNRIEFYIKPGFFDTKFLSEVSTIVNTSLRSHTHLADNGLGTVISSVQDVIINNGVFPNPTKQNEENIARLAHEIVWNEMRQILLWKSERIRELLDAAKQIKEKGRLPTSLQELNELIAAKEKEELAGIDMPVEKHPIKKEEFIPETSAILALPSQKGSGCEGIDFLNVRTPYNKLQANEVKSILSWIQSLP